MGEGDINNVNKLLFSCSVETHDQAFRVEGMLRQKGKGYHLIYIAHHHCQTSIAQTFHGLILLSFEIFKKDDEVQGG
jgi:hypothetical protein